MDIKILPSTVVQTHPKIHGSQGSDAWRRGTRWLHISSLSEGSPDLPGRRRGHSPRFPELAVLSHSLLESKAKVVPSASLPASLLSGGQLPAALPLRATHQEERALGGPVSGAARAVLFAGQDDEGKARLLVPLSGVEHIKLRRRGGRFYWQTKDTACRQRPVSPEGTWRSVCSQPSQCKVNQLNQPSKLSQPVAWSTNFQLMPSINTTSFLLLFSRSVVSYSLRTHGLQTMRFLRPWDSPGNYLYQIEFYTLTWNALLS